jgi:hypothetical protein
MRYDSLARIMIYRQLLSTGQLTYLVVDIGDVHDEIDIISKVILQYTPYDILR